MYELRLLGPVELCVSGHPVGIGPPQRRTVLAALAVDPHRRVSAETLIDRVWDGSPPLAARRALHAHIARLRRLLECTGVGQPRTMVLTRRNGEYALETHPAQIDMHRFQRLVEHGRCATRSDAERLVALREALALWRGTPMCGLPGQWAMRERERWRRLRLEAVVAWVDAELRLRPDAPIVCRLYELIDEYPLAEPLVAGLMRALHTSGRSAEAVECFAAARRRLAAELGIEPGADLHRLHARILRGDLPARPAAGRARALVRRR